MEQFKKPIPPETRYQCGLCNYTEVKSKYKHTCWEGIILGCGLALAPLMPFVILISKFMGWIE